jgi:RHS repeat-associated protein
VPGYHHYDANGNCMTLTNPAGNITEQYYYDAFGKPYIYDGVGNNVPVSPSGNRFLFTGREYISELKLYDYRNRLYNPQMGRFLQPDPKQFAAGDYNLYRYCHNDPVNKSDPTGLHDVNVLPRDEPASKWADKAPISNDRITVIGHGSQRSMIDSNGEDLPVSKLAAIIRENPKFDGKKPVVLDSCQTGKCSYHATATTPRTESYAQKLANELCVRVLAPTGKSEIHEDGKVTLDSSKGYYRVINPQKNVKEQ